MIHSVEVIEEARHWLGVKYRFGAEVVDSASIHSDPYKTGWDCSEFVEFVLAKLGYEGLMGKPFPDGSWNQHALCVKHCTLISIDTARRTPGALIFRRNGSAGQINHVAFTTGRNGTVEARGRKLGTGEWPWRDAEWSDAALIPHVDYSVDT